MKKKAIQVFETDERGSAGHGNENDESWIAPTIEKRRVSKMISQGVLAKRKGSFLLFTTFQAKKVVDPSDPEGKHMDDHVKDTL